MENKMELCMGLKVVRFCDSLSIRKLCTVAATPTLS
jgi:hypothetical protein